MPYFYLLYFHVYLRWKEKIKTNCLIFHFTYKDLQTEQRTKNKKQIFKIKHETKPVIS